MREETIDTDGIAEVESVNSVRTALYRHFDKGNRLLYIGISLSVLARLASHEQYSRWFYDIARVDVEYFPSRGAALAAEALAIGSEHAASTPRVVSCAEALGHRYSSAVQ